MKGRGLITALSPPSFLGLSYDTYGTCRAVALAMLRRHTMTVSTSSIHTIAPGSLSMETAKSLDIMLGLATALVLDHDEVVSNIFARLGRDAKNNDEEKKS
ncbi:hypothetical protein AMATHDRAFT_60984 [Amanita thiersii Skay4041]|uniref:Uncharacterized protein n=1 Tax=Amanita thiersii Skay4041 TaxID=703135 RepID=A0A2A9NM98_9AGAR|nr:hypothetical protein AMATHDRAFT_60984 [Amanita thiersii Skay4041]